MQRNISLDLLKLLMAVMVVALHANFLNEVSPLMNFLTVQGLFRLAVPTFLVINGYYFHKIVRNGNYREYFKKIFFLYVFWMILYSYFWFKPTEFSLIEIAKLLKIFVVGYFHLWYVIGLLLAALLFVLFRRFSDGVLLCLGIFLFLVGNSMQYAALYNLVDNQFVDKIFNQAWVYLNFLTVSFPFFLAGYFLRKWNLGDKLSLSSSICLAIFGFFLLIVESTLNYFFLPKAGVALNNMFSLLLFCPVLVIIFLKAKLNSSSKNIALLASSIYFVHPAVVIMLMQTLTLNSIYLTILTLVISIVVSSIFILAHKRFKFIL